MAHLGKREVKAGAPSGEGGSGIGPERALDV